MNGNCPHAEYKSTTGEKTFYQNNNLYSKIVLNIIKKWYR